MSWGWRSGGYQSVYTPLFLGTRLCAKCISLCAFKKVNLTNSFAFSTMANSSTLVRVD